MWWHENMLGRTIGRYVDRLDFNRMGSVWAKGYRAGPIIFRKSAIGY